MRRGGAEGDSEGQRIREEMEARESAVERGSIEYSEEESEGKIEEESEEAESEDI